jgi:3-methyladenine DNA glycosylase AlkD
VYDEDGFWFDYGTKRFGLPINEIIKLRKESIREIQKEIKKLERGDR